MSETNASGAAAGCIGASMGTMWEHGKQMFGDAISGNCDPAREPQRRLNYAADMICNCAAGSVSGAAAVAGSLGGKRLGGFKGKDGIVGGYIGGGTAGAAGGIAGKIICELNDCHENALAALSANPIVSEVVSW